MHVCRAVNETDIWKFIFQFLRATHWLFSNTIQSKLGKADTKIDKIIEGWKRTSVKKGM